MKKVHLFVILIPVLCLALYLTLGGSRNPHGAISLPCESCHTSNSWTEMRSDGGFSHDETNFPLIGAHEQIKCASCHRNLKFAETKNQCADCHSDIHRGKLGNQCQSCHTSESWENQQDLFEQHASAGFPLTGVHATTDCNSCHQNQLRDDYTGTPTECAGCHDDDFKSTANPSHVLAGFSTQCETCHSLSANSWQNAHYDHPPEFRLEGGHSNLECQSCHATQFAGTVNECFSCHQSDFQSAPDPDHVSANFDHNCLTCHNTNTWVPATFDHSETDFQLTGGHSGLQCITCHSDGYSQVSTDCYSCHSGDFASTDNPNHQANNFDHNCTSCHNTTAWKPSSFDHSATAFALTGAHMTVQCLSCHSSGYTNTATDCYSCHSSSFLAVSDPNHAANGFSHECQQCHTTTAWTPVNFDHTVTGFLLTDGHAGLQCANCHSGGYTNTSNDCYSCHSQNFASVTDPNHVTNGFPHDCKQCHSTVAWNPAEPRGFDHTITGFVLNGAHASVECMTCHTQGFTNTSPLCYSCHSSDFTGASDPNHVQNNFDHNCSSCHTTTAWEPATFDHSSTQFPLTGAHTALACMNCHSSGYTNTPSDCYSCHTGAFAGVTEPNHVQNNFDHNCVQCHSTSVWSPSTFNHSATDFALTGAHTSVDCVSCHTTGYTSTPTDCFSCHQTDFNIVLEPNHAMQNFSHDCTQCHSTVAWKPSNFDHSSTQFPLTGAHTSLQCISCHSQGYTNIETTCISCHQQNFDTEDNPDHGLAGFSAECQTCHTTTSWDPSDWNHSTTGFTLTGAHGPLDCKTCHTTTYTGTDPACFSCHQGDFAATTEPDHETANFDHNCLTCHNTNAWKPATFDHNSTGFPLTGGHSGVACLTCHASGYTNTSPECYSCHSGDFASASDPNHVQNNFSHDCTTCHTTTAWDPANYNHNNTDFPLTGAHTSLQCISCHSAGYTNTPTACYSCHSGDFASATDPNHVQNSFSHDCTTCHTTTAWDPASFDHSTTSFPLTGGHSGLACITCHSSGYTNTSTDCYSCHSGDFTATTTPSHVQNNFDHNCTGCHSTTAWKPSTFNHASTGFTLTGAHNGLQCIACHSQGYVNTDPACYSCHAGDFTSVTNPNHVQNNFDHNCTNCHNTTAWKPSTFNHSTTGFVLNGAHTGLQCIACHSQGYINTDPACYSCHQGDFTGTSSPNHVQNNFDHNCTTCHNTTAWKPSTFNHSTTGFILTGAHTGLQCIACHAQGYVNTPSACWDCHSGDFNSVTDPNHVQNNFSHLCSTCHTTTAWSPASFNHSTTSFPLTGAHATLQCIACHSGGYTNTPTNCVACHQSEYNSTTTPNHTAANFPTNCQTCHSTTAWTPANWNHDSQYFPIYSGKHREKWDQCSDCHTNPSNYAVFSCLGCHEHNKTDMDDKHRGRPGYQYNSNACLNCHPTGNS